MAESSNPNTSVHFEHRDVNVRSMAWVIAAIVVTAIVLHAVLYFLYAGFRSGVAESGRMPKSLDQPRQQTTDQPKLQVDPATDINQLREEENKILNTYGWVDKNKGTVRIPIEQAIELVADRGLHPTNSAKQSLAPAQQAVSKQR